MSLNLLEVVRAVQLREATFSAETAGYLVLAAADQLCRVGNQARAQAILIQDTGELLIGDGAPSTPDAVEISLRSLLARLLQLCHVGHSGMNEVSVRRRAAPALVAELEAALIPVNRAAARRALARIYRETERARKKGLLKDLFDAKALLEPPDRKALGRRKAERAPSQVDPGAKKRSSRPAVVWVDPADAPRRVVRQTATAEALRPDGELDQSEPPPPLEVEEHTVRLDQIQLNLQVALRKSHERSRSEDCGGDEAIEAVPHAFDRIRAALTVLPTDETPFLGSITTASDRALIPAPLSDSRMAAHEAEIEGAWDEIAASRDVSSHEGSAFSLDISAPFASDDLTDEVMRRADEPETERAAVREKQEPDEPTRFYTPRKSDLSELLQSFAAHSEQSAGDIPRQLKELAGVEAKPNPLRRAAPRSALFKGEAFTRQARRTKRSFASKPLD